MCRSKTNFFVFDNGQPDSTTPSDFWRRQEEITTRWKVLNSLPFVLDGSHLHCLCGCVWSLRLSFRTERERATDSVRARVQLTIHGETPFYSLCLPRGLSHTEDKASHHTFLCVKVCVSGYISFQMGRHVLLNLVCFSHNIQQQDSIKEKQTNILRSFINWEAVNIWTAD